MYPRGQRGNFQRDPWAPVHFEDNRLNWWAGSWMSLYSHSRSPYLLSSRGENITHHVQYFNWYLIWYLNWYYKSNGRTPTASIKNTSIEQTLQIKYIAVHLQVAFNTKLVLDNLQHANILPLNHQDVRTIQIYSGHFRTTWPCSAFFD